MRSFEVKENVSVKTSMKSSTERWLTNTPLGIPVEPEVKLT